MSSIASLGVLAGALSAGQVAKNISLEDVSITPSTSQQTITAGEGYDGIGTATVSAVALENKTVTPTASQQVITAGEGYLGLGTVTVEASSGGEDTLNTLFNTPAGQTPTPFTMSDDNANHTCYGFLNGLNITLDSGIKSVETNAFDRAVALKSVSGSGVETIKQNAFSQAMFLASASFPNCKTIQKQAFDSCSSLETIGFPAVETIGDKAFYNCESLSSVSFLLCQTVGEEAFNNCGSITSIDLPACVTVGKNAFGSMNYTSINLPVCTTLGEEALRDFKGQVLRLPAVQTMGRQQFRWCENMTDLYLGYDGVVAVTREDEFFDWEMFPNSGPMTISVHVPIDQLANYQSDATWTAIVTASASDNVTVTFVGDYE